MLSSSCGNLGLEQVDRARFTRVPVGTFLGYQKNSKMYIVQQKLVDLSMDS